MIKKKVVMLGSFAVGKTSLVQQFVNSIFSDKYQTTIGVKIDQKILNINNQDINLLLWDIHGEDDYQKIKPIYITGSSGCFIVIDGTRSATIDVGLKLRETFKKIAPNAPIIILINKADLKNEWEITEDDINRLKTEDIIVYQTSAKTGEYVDEAFEKITRLMTE